MEELGKLAKDELEGYLAQQPCQKLLDLVEKCENPSGPLAQSVLSTFFSKVDETDPLYSQGLLLSAKSLKETEPLLSLSKLLNCFSLVPSLANQVFPLTKEILSKHRTAEFLSILEKFIEQSSGLLQIHYLRLMIDLQPKSSIVIYNNIWDILYDLNIPIDQLAELLDCTNELMPKALQDLTPTQKPKIVYKSKFLETWWVCDTTENKAYVYFSLLINDLRSTLQKSVTADLIAIILTLGLNSELGLKLAQAGIQVVIEPLDNCLEIKVAGHASNVLDASEKIMEFIYNSSPTDETFEASLGMLRQQYTSMTSDPTNQSRQLRLAFLQHQQYLYPEKLKYLSDSTYTDLNFANVKILLFASGHVSETQTSDLAEFIEGLLFAAEGRKLKYLTPRTVTLLPDQIIELVQNALVDTNGESVLEVYFQFGQASVEERVLTTLLEMIVSETITEEFVNVKKLATSVAVSSRMTRGVSGLLIKLLCVEFHPDTVQMALFDFMSRIQSIILKNFADKKNALLEIKQQGFRGLAEKSAFYWDEILQGNLEFERDLKEVEYLRGVHCETVVEWVQRQKVVSRALVIKVIDSKWGAVSHRFTEEFSMDIETVRNRLPCYSWLRIMH